MSEASATKVGISSSFRWWQLILGIVCMASIANLQYGWTFFVPPMLKAHPDWTPKTVQSVFALFILLETFCTPLNGWIADRIGRAGPRLVVALGGVLVAIGWVINSFADSISMLYVGAIIGGLGGGGVYAVCVGNAVKWFADRRGLAVGFTAGGYGAGTALSVIPLQWSIGANGYQNTFFWFGIAQGLIVFVLAWFMRGPVEGEAPASAVSKNVTQTKRQFAWHEMLLQPTFWLLYFMFVVISASGLMATAQLSLIAKDFGVGSQLLALGMTTLTLAGIVDNVANGAARPFFGWISDRIGRERTMALAFGLGGISYFLLGATGTNPWLFVLFAGMIFFTWGEIFSLFPSTCTDTFGAKFATVNAALLYTAKGVSSLLIPAANVAVEFFGGWHEVFTFTAIANFVIVGLALFVLRPLRAKLQARNQNVVPAQTASAT